MKYLIAITCLFAGYIVYPLLNPAPAIPETSKNKFESFINEEAKAFAMIQDADAKLKAAEEMYGKMMLLLLAELGVKSQHQLKPVIPSEPLADVNSQVKADQKIPSSDLSLSPVTSPIAESSSPKKNIRKDKLTEEQEWKRYSTTPFMESIKGKDERLIGRFEGTMTHETVPDTGRVDLVMMHFNLFQNNKEIEGDTLVTMTNPEGKEYSRNSGDGGNRAIKGIADERDSYFVEASPSSYFLLNLRFFPQVSGKYFNKGKFVGNVQLRKTGR